jgi:hypothetical protein
MGCVTTKSNIASPKPILRHNLDSEHKKTTITHDTTKEITHSDFSIVHKTPLQQFTQVEESSIQLNPLESTPVPALPIIIVTPLSTSKLQAKAEQPKILETKRQLSEITIEPQKISQQIQSSVEPNLDSLKHSEQKPTEQIHEEDYTYEEEDSIMRDYFSLVKHERPKGHMKSLSQQIVSNTSNFTHRKTRSKFITDANFKPHNAGKHSETESQEQFSSNSSRNIYTYRDNDVKLPRIKKYNIFRHDLDMYEINKLLEDLNL